MTDKEKILAVLREAMQAERSGHYFYTMAAERTTDEQGRRALLQLAEEEASHLRFLKAQYQAVESNGRPDAGIKLGSPGAATGSIFSPELRRRIAEAHYEMTALAVGIQLEVSSRDYYRARAEEAQDDVVKDFFQRLADWEQGHYQALLGEQQSLKEDYWQQAGFAPF